MKIKYFVHGTTFDNAEGVCSGWKDIDLNETGKQRVINLGNLLQNEKFDVIFTSDLKRAIHSAELAFPTIKHIQDARLRECNYGELDGKNKKLIEYDNHIYTSFPNGESLIDVEKRVESFIEFLKENYYNQSIGIVAHRATQLAFEVITKKISWEKAIKNDWRNTNSWQPGWEYML